MILWSWSNSWVVLFTFQLCKRQMNHDFHRHPVQSLLTSLPAIVSDRRGTVPGHKGMLWNTTLGRFWTHRSTIYNNITLRVKKTKYRHHLIEHVFSIISYTLLFFFLVTIVLLSAPFARYWDVKSSNPPTSCSVAAWVKMILRSRIGHMDALPWSSSSLYIWNLLSIVTGYIGLPGSLVPNINRELKDQGCVWGWLVLLHAL